MRQGILLLLLFYIFIPDAHAGVIKCCAHANGSCRLTCSQISLVELATDPQVREFSLQKLNNLCHKPHMVGFWKCMNETLDEIDKGRGWTGRSCCNLPQSEKCIMTCLKAQSLLDLTEGCRQSDEIAFYNCIDKQDDGERCCKRSRTPGCKEACQYVFQTSFTPSKDVRDAVQKQCSFHNPGVMECIRNYIHVTPATNPYRYMSCCDKTTETECNIACKELLLTETTGQELVDALTKRKCGPVLLGNPFWQCFLANSEPNRSGEPNSSTLPTETKEPGGPLIQSENIGLDSAKMQCCSRAATMNCQRLCHEIFQRVSTVSTTWVDFDRLCLQQLAETELIRCLHEVDEPCEVGCEGLNYCTNFNSRPTELFRSCTPKADLDAKTHIEQWEEGIITLPFVQIPIHRISECHPDVWKAIACALKIKPCHREAHTNRICKSDCQYILSKCIDRSRLVGNQNHITLCEILSPPGNDTPCISLSPYLEESRHLKAAAEVTHPCQPNRCNPKGICMVERNCLSGQPCHPYMCVPGCRMGDKSQFIVPRNTYVRLPSNTDGPKCPMVCYCNQDSLLEDCITPNCPGINHCNYGGRRYSHNTKFVVENNCKTCFCYDGEVTCTPKQCESGLPCKCVDHYVPVCGANGKTYPSACLARCAGLADDQYEFGGCYESDPCSPNSCHPYHKCVPRKRVCLSIGHRSCKQYDCVNMQHNCNQMPKSPVCDTDNVEHKNICWMLQRRKSLGYYGKCMPHCRGSGLVCGHNGETYASECAAWSERVPVDYKGPCAAVGYRHGKHPRCGGIKCSPLPSEDCTKVYPPGGCCPVCGAALRLLYSQKLSDWSVDAIRDVDPVVIQNVAENLREHVKVTECEVFAYLSLDSDIIVLVIAISDSPTILQVNACISEAQKLRVLIEQQSPTLLIELPLSYFTTAIMIEPVTDNGIRPIFNLSYLYAILLVLLALYNKTTL